MEYELVNLRSRKNPDNSHSLPGQEVPVVIPYSEQKGWVDFQRS